MEDSMVSTTDSPTKELLDKTRAPIDLHDLPEDALKEIQGYLDAVGFECKVDGVYGSQTSLAWLDFLASIYSKASPAIGWGSLEKLRKLAEESRVITSVKESLPTIEVPGIGLVPLNQPIVEGCGITWGEMTRQGSRMPVSKSVARNMVAFCTDFVPLRERIGEPIFITSAYRPPHINAAVGGSTKSWHLYNRPGQGAIDFFVDSKSARALCRELDPHWTGGMAWSPQGFLHVDNGPEGTWKY